MLKHKELTDKIRAAATEVHQAPGPELFEPAYEQCLCHELTSHTISFKRQVSLPVSYRGLKIDCSHRADLVFQDTVVLELKCVENLTDLFKAQLLTYMKLGSFPVGC